MRDILNDSGIFPIFFLIEIFSHSAESVFSSGHDSIVTSRFVLINSKNSTKLVFAKIFPGFSKFLNFQIIKMMRKVKKVKNKK